LLKIMTLADGARSTLDNGRGEKIKLVDEGLTETLDLHHNTLFAHGGQGRYHRHSKADNVYIVTKGKGELIADGVTHEISEGQVIFIPAGMPHSLGNPGDEPFGIFEIYAPAGSDFDFIPVER
jgi:mannose-6-phosphate isomerase-like protein (cupin superfamily)